MKTATVSNLSQILSNYLGVWLEGLSKTTKILTTAGLLAYIRTLDIPNTKQECQPFKAEW